MDRQTRPPLAAQRRPASGILGWLFFFLVLLVLWQLYGFPAQQETRLSYSRFRSELEAGNVASVVVEGRTLRGSLEEAAEIERTEGEAVEVKRFLTHLPAFGTDALLDELEAAGVEITVEPQSEFPWAFFLIAVLPLLLLVGFAVVAARGMQSQGRRLFGFSRSPARRYDRETDAITFDRVAGNENARRELREIIEFLKDPGRFHQLGAEVPRGVLLQGPPGTGKTLMARAVAGEAEVPFFSITGSDFMEMLVGVGASRVRNMFKDAKREAPSILFIDELDSIGRRRGSGLGGGHDEREQTLNQLLSEMDGFEPNENVIVMAATNRPDILDRALLRPGRFDRVVTTELPRRDAREQILRLHARSKPLADRVDLASVARGTPGFSGADLENLLNEAALRAAREEKKEIGMEDIEEARDKVVMGMRRENVDLSEEELRTLAYHESGHAVVAARLEHADPLHKVSIVPRGKAMGATQQLPEKDRYLYSREYLLDRLAVMLGGRAAESLVLDTVTSGAEDDLKQVTRLARKMVLEWGMSEKLGHMALGGDREEVFLGEELAQRREYSEDTAREIDREIRAIQESAYERALETLRTHRDGLDRLAECLLEEEELTGERVLELVGTGEGPAQDREERKVGA